MRLNEKREAIKELLAEVASQLERCQEGLEESKARAANLRQLRVKAAEQDSADERALEFAKVAFEAMEEIKVEAAEETGSECHREVARDFIKRWVEIEESLAQGGADGT